MTQDDGGTDKVAVLFPDRPSAAPIEPQPQILTLLDHLAEQVKSGKCVGLIALAFDAEGNIDDAILGKMSVNDAIGGLERVKFQALARDHAKRLGIK